MSCTDGSEQSVAFDAPYDEIIACTSGSDPIVPPGYSAFVGDTFDADYVGPRAVGIRALLVDPTEHHAVDPDDRLASILELPDRLPR